MSNAFIKIISGILIFLLSLFMANVVFAQHGNHSPVRSPYAGEKHQDIKSLTKIEIEGLLAGAGTPFGGMAKAAELNGYPGPRHVLDAHEAGEFDLTEEQLKKITRLFEKMQTKAQQLGELIIATEKELDRSFKGKDITPDLLRKKVEVSAEIYGQLRFIHLNTHLQMIDILTEDQIALYNELRGYAMSGPCEIVPEGHDAELWKKHNDCE